MCGLFGLALKIKTTEGRFDAKVQEGVEILPNYNIRPGQFTAVITDHDPETIQLFQFGLARYFSGKKKILINARSEGITYKKSFMVSIRSQRCLVIADYFIEGTTKEKLDKPFVVYLRDKVRPFAMAGIWDSALDNKSGEIVHSFSIITTKANDLIEKFPKDRMPVILPQKYEKKWLKQDIPLSDVTELLRPYPAELMNAYPISAKIKNPKATGVELLNPIGDKVIDESRYKVDFEKYKRGFGRHKIKH